MKTHNIPIKARRRALIAALVFGTALLIFGAVLLLQRYSVTSKKASPISSAPVTYSVATPEESQPDCDNYKTSAKLPRHISLPSIKSSGCIQPVGIDQNKAIAVPTNIHLAGWYTNSALPNDPGVTLIVGHVTGKYNDAIFRNLKELKKGDRIEIQRGDGSVVAYAVTTAESLTQKDTANKMLAPAKSKSELRLITCTGQFDRKANTYDKRLLVTAQPL